MYFTKPPVPQCNPFPHSNLLIITPWLDLYQLRCHGNTRQNEKGSLYIRFSSVFTPGVKTFEFKTIFSYIFVVVDDSPIVCYGFMYKFDIPAYFIRYLMHSVFPTISVVSGHPFYFYKYTYVTSFMSMDIFLFHTHGNASCTMWLTTNTLFLDYTLFSWLSNPNSNYHCTTVG